MAQRQRESDLWASLFTPLDNQTDLHLDLPFISHSTSTLLDAGGPANGGTFLNSARQSMSSLLDIISNDPSTLRSTLGDTDAIILEAQLGFVVRHHPDGRFWYHAPSEAEPVGSSAPEPNLILERYLASRDSHMDELVRNSPDIMQQDMVQPDIAQSDDASDSIPIMRWHDDQEDPEAERPSLDPNNPPHLDLHRPSIDSNPIPRLQIQRPSLDSNPPPRLEPRTDRLSFYYELPEKIRKRYLTEEVRAAVELSSIQTHEEKPSGFRPAESRVLPSDPTYSVPPTPDDTEFDEYHAFLRGERLHPDSNANEIPERLPSESPTVPFPDQIAIAAALRSSGYTSSRQWLREWKESDKEHEYGIDMTKQANKVQDHDFYVSEGFQWLSQG
ncbi:hypothetical protein ACJ41O_005669 [Fusarium nematophilum]